MAGQAVAQVAGLPALSRHLQPAPRVPPAMGVQPHGHGPNAVRRRPRQPARTVRR